MSLLSAPSEVSPSSQLSEIRLLLAELHCEARETGEEDALERQRSFLCHLFGVEGTEEKDLQAEAKQPALMEQKKEEKEAVGNHSSTPQTAVEVIEIMSEDDDEEEKEEGRPEKKNIKLETQPTHYPPTDPNSTANSSVMERSSYGYNTSLLIETGEKAALRKMADNDEAAAERDTWLYLLDPKVPSARLNSLCTYLTEANDLDESSVRDLAENVVAKKILREKAANAPVFSLRPSLLALGEKYPGAVFQGVWTCLLTGQECFLDPMFLKEILTGMETGMAQTLLAVFLGDRQIDESSLAYIDVFLSASSNVLLASDSVQDTDALLELLSRRLADACSALPKSAKLGRTLHSVAKNLPATMDDAAFTWFRTAVDRFQVSFLKKSAERELAKRAKRQT